MAGFEQFLQIVSNNDFIERPVELMEFVQSPDYMNMPEIELSVYQKQVIEKSTQIYKLESLQYLYGEQRGRELDAARVREVICQIGKGGGKNFVSTVSLSYLVHKLLCLKDPHRYYRKPSGDSIDLLNIAINAAQASNNFFTPFSTRLKKSPWFADKIADIRKNDVEFSSNVHAYSGHSDREGMEGYNVMVAVLDEISGFAVDEDTDNPSAKTAKGIYLAYRASVTSRYPEYGKLIMLSFPRYKGDFISQHYEKVVEVVDREVKHVTLRRNPELPETAPGNKYELTYEIDHIQAYSEPRVFAIRRPSFMFNPERVIDDYVGDIFYDPVDALTRYFCMPPEAESAFFRNVLPLHEQFGQDSVTQSPFVEDTWQFKPGFKADPTKTYFMHVDIGYKFDRAAVAMAHVESWSMQRNFAAPEPVPEVVIDALRYWTPTTENNVELADIKQFILQMRAMGFHIQKVTFDQFQSVQIIQELNNMGIFAEKLSVQRPHYGEFAVALYDGRIDGYRDDILLEEFVGIRLLKNNKVDHPAKGSNDLADAVVGAVYNAINESEPPTGEIEVRMGDYYDRPVQPNPIVDTSKPKPPPMPPEIAEYVARARII